MGAGWIDTLFRCPECKDVAPLDAYDVGGLDGDDLACNNCGHIGVMKMVNEIQGELFDACEACDEPTNTPA